MWCEYRLRYFNDEMITPLASVLVNQLNGSRQYYAQAGLSAAYDI